MTGLQPRHSYRTADAPQVGAHNGGKILIVEDEFLVALQLEDMLVDEGFQVVGTVPDQASLSSVAHAPDVALVDLNLRDGLTGPAIARHLAQAFATKVVYVTANPNQIDAPAPTAVGIIQKPFCRAAILAAIEYALGRRPADQLPAGLKPVRAA